MTTLTTRLYRKYLDYHTLFYLCIISILAELAYAIINQSALPPYLRSISLGEQVGMVMSMFLVVEASLKSPMGSLGDRLGRRPLIVGGALISCVTALLVTVVHRFWGLMVLRAVDGVAAAAIWPTLIAAVSGSVPCEKRTTAMNAMTVTYMTGIAFGPLLGGFANDATHSVRAAFYLVSVIFLITALVAIFLTPHRSKEEVEALHEGETHLRFSDILLGIKAVPDMMVLAFLAFFGVGLLIPVIKYFAMDQFGLSETGYGVLVLPIALGVALASLFAGRMGDRWGKARSVRLGIGIAAFGMWMVTVSTAAWHLVFAAMFLGIGFVFAMPSWLALVADMSAPRVRGTVIGALGTAQGIGAVIGASLGSYLYYNVTFGYLGIHLSSHYSPFVVSAFALTVCFLLVLFLVRDGDTRRIGMPNAKREPVASATE